MQKNKSSKKRKKDNYYSPPSNNDILSSCITNLQNLSHQIKQSSALHVNSNLLKTKIKDFVKSYFQTIRVDLKQNNLETDSLDEQVQFLLSLANSRSLVSSYKTTLSLLEKSFRTLESQQLIVESNKLVETRNSSSEIVAVGQDKKIIDLLSKILPPIALSYQQVLIDISEKRLSYKGTASEQREILREVLDYLAPDSEVMIIPSFKLEKDRTLPTMKQKVRFILKKRNKSQSAIEVPENATAIIEESIAKLARATYNRGSLSTHTETEKKEVVNLKRYLDSVLCELLEIY